MSTERIDSLKGACAFAGGTVVAGCSTSGRVATCRYADASGLTVVETFYPGVDLIEEHAACSSEGGTWTYY